MHMTKKQFRETKKIIATVTAEEHYNKVSFRKAGEKIELKVNPANKDYPKSQDYYLRGLIRDIVGADLKTMIIIRHYATA